MPSRERLAKKSGWKRKGWTEEFLHAAEQQALDLLTNPDHNPKTTAQNVLKIVTAMRKGPRFKSLVHERQTAAIIERLQEIERQYTIAMRNRKRFILNHRAQTGTTIRSVRRTR